MKKIIAAACVACANPALAGTLVVLNKSDATASLVDIPSYRVIATLNTGVGPHEVAISPDGHQAVVSNYGDKEGGNTLTLIDIPNVKVTGKIHLGSYIRPHGIAYIGSNQLLVTAEDQQAVVKIDITKKSVEVAIPTEQKISHMLAVDSKNNRAFVSNIGTSVISVIDLNKNTKITDVQTDKGPEGIAYNEKANEVWVANRAANNLSVIDGTSLKVKAVLKTDKFPIRVKFTPDQKLVLVTNAQTGSLSVYNASLKTLLKTINFPKSNMDTAGKMFGDAFKESSVPIGIEIDPKGNSAFIAHASLDQISVLDLTSLELVNAFKAGREPDGMAYSALAIKTDKK